MIIKQDYLPVGHISRPGKPMNHPTSITIHWIGPHPKQSVYDPRSWWLKGPDGKGLAASAHYIIKDSECLQCIPENEVAWHAGGKGNYSSLGIEVIPMNIAGEFSQDSIDTLIELLKQLPKLPLLRHYDWTGKECPLYYVNEDRWITLKNELEEGRNT